jgi:hypothetical protein
LIFFRHFNLLQKTGETVYLTGEHAFRHMPSEIVLPLGLHHPGEELDHHGRVVAQTSINSLFIYLFI